MVYAKGTEITNKTRVSISLEQIFYLNRGTEVRTALYCCDEDIAPERKGESGKHSLKTGNRLQDAKAAGIIQ